MIRIQRKRNDEMRADVMICEITIIKMPHEWYQDAQSAKHNLKVSNDAISFKSLGNEFYVLGGTKRKGISP